MADRVGQQLGNYRLLRLLGRGGFAEVYLGQHVRLNSQAAIKILHTHLADEDIQHFQAEAQTIANLDHPNIVRLQDFDVQDGTPFLVMQYAPHGSLRTLHPKGTRLPLETVVRYVQQVADALQHAHDQRLIHRDIKPENLLLGRRGEVLLSDFGIALVMQSSRYQSTQEVVGTIAYMAPEQIQGHPRPASDQYSLAIVVYEWLSGERPFQGSVSEVVAQHLSVPPSPFALRVPGLHPTVEQVVLTALAKDPKERFGSMQAFATALSQTSLMDHPTQVIGLGAPVSHPIIPQTPSISTQLPATPLPTPLNAELPLTVPRSVWEGASDSTLQRNIHPPLPQPVQPIKEKHPLRTILVSVLLVSLLAGGGLLGLNLASKKSSGITGNLSQTPTFTLTTSPTATTPPTATPSPTVSQPNLSGTWTGQSSSGVTYTLVLTQSGSSITGNGIKSDGATLAITGSIAGYAVTLKVYVTRDNCYQHDTLTLSADYQSMSGYLQSDCNGAILTFTLSRQ